MENYSFLNKYKVLSEGSENDLESIFYPLSSKELEEVEEEFQIHIPHELQRFYVEIGYGFINKSSGDFNRLMGPFSFAQINLKLNEFEYDPDLELYDDLYQGEKLLFLEVNEGVYLAIDKIDIEGKNAIYYFKDKIADSLEEFLKQFVDNPNLIKDLE